MTVAPALLVGPLPAWASLGSVVDRDGVSARELLGDYSHLHECDRPPQFIVEGEAPLRRVFDRSVDRLPVKQYLPGKSVAELAGKHSGKVALLFNGPSLSGHDLFSIPFPLIGMNRTHVGHAGYSGPQPDYLCVIDAVWVLKESVRKHPRVIDGGVDPRDIGYRVVRNFRSTPFSLDLYRDGFVPFVPGTTGFLALQLAVFLGFRDIYCLGLDLGGDHFDGTGGTQRYNFSLMRQHFKHMVPTLKKAGVRVTVCGSPDSACNVFEHSTFEELCATGVEEWKWKARRLVARVKRMAA